MATLLGGFALLMVIAVAAILYASYTLMDKAGSVAMDNDQDPEVSDARRNLCRLQFELQTASELHLDVAELSQNIAQAETDLRLAVQRAEQRASNPGTIRVGEPVIKIRPVPLAAPASSFHSKQS